MVKIGEINFQKKNSSKALIADTLNPQNSEEQDAQEQKINQVIQESQQALTHIKSAALFDLFPVEITVDVNKVNVITSELFGNLHVQSILISEISDIEIDAASLSTMKFIEAHNKNITEVKNLRYKDADKVRNIVLGILIAGKNNIDLTKIDTSKLSEKLEKLGQGVF